jgi:hypothetical protein
MLKTDGSIEEPNIDPDDVFDLTGYSLWMLLLLPLSIPIVLILKLKDMLVECLWVVKRWVAQRRALHASSSKKRKSFFHRVKKTFSR